MSRVTPGLLMPLASSRSTSTMLATQNWPPLPSQYCHSSVTQLHCCDAVTAADLARSCSSSAPQRHLVSGLARLPGLCADITSAQLKAASPSHQPRARAVASSPALDRSILVVTLRAGHCTLCDREVEQLGPEAVGDVPDARLHLLGHPERAGGLEHPGLPGVRHQEGVVVAEVRQRVGAGAALAVRAQEAGDHLAGGGHVTRAGGLRYTATSSAARAERPRSSPSLSRSIPSSRGTRSWAGSLSLVHTASLPITTPSWAQTFYHNQLSWSLPVQCHCPSEQ